MERIRDILRATNWWNHRTRRKKGRWDRFVLPKLVELWKLHARVRFRRNARERERASEWAFRNLNVGLPQTNYKFSRLWMSRRRFPGKSRDSVYALRRISLLSLSLSLCSSPLSLSLSPGMHPSYAHPSGFLTHLVSPRKMRIDRNAYETQRITVLA